MIFQINIVMVASREAINKPTVENIDNIYSSVLGNASILRALSLRSLHEERKKLGRISEKEKTQNEQLEGLKKRLFDTVNSDCFLNTLKILATQFEEQTYSIVNPKINPKTTSSNKGSFALGYDMQNLIRKTLDSPSMIVDFYPNYVLQSEEESFVRRSAVLMDMNYWNGSNGNKNSLLKQICDHLQISISLFGDKYFYILAETNIFNKDLFIEGLNLVYSINPNKNLEEYIKNIVNESWTYDILEDESERLCLNYFNFRKSYNEYNIKNGYTESVTVFFEKLINLVERFIDQNSGVKEISVPKITQDQIDFISERTYGEIQQLKTLEANPEMISLYNHRLVELVDEGVSDAVNFVSQNAKMLELYQDKDFKKLLTALKTKFEIPFINEGEINPNGQRVLNDLNQLSFETNSEQLNPEGRRVRVFTRHKWAKIIESYDDVNRKSLFEDCKNYINLIEINGGVRAFVQQIKSNSDLDYNNHKGSNKMGIDLSNAWIFRIGSSGGRIAFDLDTNEVVYVGMHYED
jgi:hypothetical protein